MSDIENRVIGGPHHGEYHDFPDRDYITLPIRERLPSTFFTGPISPEAITFRKQGYHRHCFYSTVVGEGAHGTSVWIPDNVPQGRVMAHVLGMALRAPKP